MDFNEYCGAYKQYIQISKTGAVTTVAGAPATTVVATGFPGAATTPGNTTTGVVPTDLTTGFPLIQAPQGSDKLRLSRVEAQSPVDQVLTLYDVLFWAGPTTIPTTGTTTVALSGQPSYTGRLPLQSDGVTPNYAETELWAWLSTAGSNHAHSVSGDYTDQSGNLANNTGNVATQNVAVNRILRLPWAAGDNGARKLEGYKVNGATSSTGAVVVMVMRRLWQGRVFANNQQQTWGPDLTGLPHVPADAALMLVCTPVSTSTSTPFVLIELAHGT
jgi:hypothetical protein